jgi:hypothetical protein
LGIPNAYIGELLPKLIDDILEIVLDPICPPLTKVVSSILFKKAYLLLFRGKESF